MMGTGNQWRFTRSAPRSAPGGRYKMLGRRVFGQVWVAKLFGIQLIEPCSQFLGEAAGIGKDQR